MRVVPNPLAQRVVRDKNPVCPVNGFYHFSDTWDAPREGGRLHKGTDILSVVGMPLVALEDSIIESFSDDERAGLNVYLVGVESGNRYLYAHMDTLEPLKRSQLVLAGEKLGTVGHTGNADEEWPHPHIEREVDGIRINPYPYLAELCPNRLGGEKLAVLKDIQQTFGEDWLTASKIAYCESEFDTTAVNDNPATGDYSVGLFQINLYGGLSRQRPVESWLKNPYNNIEYAYDMFKEQGWQPWSCLQKITPNEG